METTVQIDNMRYGSDGAAEHFLFQGRGDTHILDGVLQTETEMEDVFQLLAEIIVRYGIGVLAIAVQNGEKRIDIFQRGDLLQQSQRDEMRNLISIVPLLHRIVDDSLLDVIADHGTGHILKAQRPEALIDILGCLLQIKSLIGEFLIPWETKSTYGAGKYVCNLHIHMLIIVPGEDNVNDNWQ